MRRYEEKLREAKVEPIVTFSFKDAPLLIKICKSTIISALIAQFHKDNITAKMEYDERYSKKPFVIRKTACLFKSISYPL